MALLLLIRHGMTDQTGKRLYGTSPGIRLSDEGRRQAEHLVHRLDGLSLGALYSSPLERCRETIEPLARHLGLVPTDLDEVREVEYGELTGTAFEELRRLPLWRRAEVAPSSVRFPGGETLGEVQQRAVAALAEVAERHRGSAVGVVTHGDVIRLALAHHAGIHLDLYRRLEVDPASVSAVTIDRGGSRVVRVNDTGRMDDLADYTGSR